MAHIIQLIRPLHRPHVLIIFHPRHTSLLRTHEIANPPRFLPRYVHPFLPSMFSQIPLLAVEFDLGIHVEVEVKGEAEGCPCTVE